MFRKERRRGRGWISNVLGLSWSLKIYVPSLHNPLFKREVVEIIEEALYIMHWALKGTFKSNAKTVNLYRIVTSFLGPFVPSRVPSVFPHTTPASGNFLLFKLNYIQFSDKDEKKLHLFSNTINLISKLISFFYSSSRDRFIQKLNQFLPFVCL